MVSTTLRPTIIILWDERADRYVATVPSIYGCEATGLNPIQAVNNALTEIERHEQEKRATRQGNP